MAVFKCKMCGGELSFHPGESLGTCDYCGTEQTLPKVMDENLQALFNRANVLRMKAEFDKAAEIYEKILQVSGTEAEAYWGLILCKYGIEYVEDPATYKRVPTCHRASFDAVTADDDYRMALQYADLSQRAVYEAEAKQIDEIQKGIVALARNEAPYDVFICYKETDAQGKRTVDSVIANDIYHQLTQEGFKVFYAAITLEDKLGQEYEPYIFSALNSSKVMLSIGTKAEYFNAVWVKNEWSRFLKIMKKDRARMLIPCYKDMDAYELPEEFAHLQAQDMSKIGFINDIVRGIKKVIVKEDNVGATASGTAAPVPTAVQQNSSHIQALLERGNMAIEDGEWEKADGFFEEVLNQDAKSGDAYIGKLLVKSKKRSIEELQSFYINRYAQTTDSEVLSACEPAAKYIAEQVEKKIVPMYLERNAIEKEYEYDLTYVSELSYRRIQKEIQMSELKNDKLLARALQYATGKNKEKLEHMLVEIKSTLDARIKESEVKDKENAARIMEEYKAYLSETDVKTTDMYKKAIEKREERYQLYVRTKASATTIEEYHRVKECLWNMKGYKDTKALAEECEKEIERIKEEQEKKIWEERYAAEAKRCEEEQRRRKKILKILIIGASSIAAIIVIVQIVTKVIIPANNYKKAVALKEEGRYQEAYDEFKKLGDYKDAKEQMEDTDYEKAVALKEEGEYREAYEEFERLGDYKDAKEQMADFKLKIVKDSEIGDTISFGEYNGNTEWIILSKEDSQALIISTYVIEIRPYHDDIFTLSRTWENCSLRAMLNNEYLNNAFSEQEKSIIKSTEIENLDNPEYGIDGGNNTTDRVFCLSIEEAEKYFTDDESRKATSVDGTSSSWWLRSPGFGNNGHAAYIGYSGVLSMRGTGIHRDFVGVRPAMWLDLSKF